MKFHELLHKDLRDLLKRRKQVDPIQDPASFGNIAVERGYITKEVLQGSVIVQQEQLRMGEILVAMGHLSPNDCEDILIEQARRRATSLADIVETEFKLQRHLLGRVSSATKKLTRMLNSDSDDTSEFPTK